MDLFSQAVVGMRTCDADEKIIAAARGHLERWLKHAEFAGYYPQIEWLIKGRKWAELLDRFYQILPFGTGGRRGPVGIGPNRMNLWTLGASVQGHCEYLKKRFASGEALHVVVAYDVRQFEDVGRHYNPELSNPVLGLSSKDFARHAVSIYAANGIHSFILDPKSSRYLATPELSFFIRHLQAHGGLNISASHNPPDDNGGKFYDERGAQPVPPEDQRIAELVDQITSIKELPWEEAVRSGYVHFLEDSEHDAYLELCCKQSLIAPPRSDEMKIVFTPLHGVGSMTALEVLQKRGFRCVTVDEQMPPDGRFSNVTKSPNPEVPECMDRAETLAREINAELVLATDPDADRVGAMIPRHPKRPDTDWCVLNGNEIAGLLTHFKLTKLAESGGLLDSAIVIKTLVTTKFVSRIACHFGTQVVENLPVGFKYIADVMWHLEKNGMFQKVKGSATDVVIGVEESHGYLLTPEMRDKDAAASALILAELTLDAQRGGTSVWEYLNELWQQFGYFRNILLPVVLPGLEGKQQMAQMLDSLRKDPPKEIAGLPVTDFVDLRDESNWMGPIKGETDYAARNVLVFYLGERGRIALRPSGTEPKAKAYIEISSAPRSANQTDDEWRHSCRQVDTLATQTGSEFLRLALGRVSGRQRVKAA